MTQYDWLPFLKEFSGELLADEEIRSRMPKKVMRSEWMGFPGASEAEILSLEQRLGVQLPPSYREFLAISNGWRSIGTFIDKLWPTSKVAWFRERNQQWIDAYVEPSKYLPPVTDEEYFVYGDEQDPARIRVEYLQTALEISDIGDSAICLLNPKIVTQDGEWEAWFFANWLPGAHRYRSFWELMQGEYQSFLSVREYAETQLLPDDDSTILVAKLPRLVAELQRKIQLNGNLASKQTKDVLNVRYGQGIIDGLKFAETRVREIQVQNQHPGELCQQLRELADELETKAQQGTQAVPKVSDLVAALSGNMGNLLDLLQMGAVAQGYQEAGAIVRWFLNEHS